jgi:hypothetical protein
MPPAVTTHQQQGRGNPNSSTVVPLTNTNQLILNPWSESLFDCCKEPPICK